MLRDEVPHGAVFTGFNRRQGTRGAGMNPRRTIFVDDGQLLGAGQGGLDERAGLGIDESHVNVAIVDDRVSLTQQPGEAIAGSIAFPALVEGFTHILTVAGRTIPEEVLQDQRSAREGLRAGEAGCFDDRGRSAARSIMIFLFHRGRDSGRFADARAGPLILRRSFPETVGPQRSYLLDMSARPLTEFEYTTLAAHLAAVGRTRDRLLLVLGCGTGYRITELLSLRVGDVWREGDVVREVTIARRNLKGGRGVHCRSVRGRRVVLSEPVRSALREHLAVIGTGNPDLALFTSAKARGEPMGRSMVFRILREVCSACSITNARVSTHTLRKTFVRRVYEASGHDLIATQRIVGHTSPTTTARYLETDTAKLDDLVRHLAA